MHGRARKTATLTSIHHTVNAERGSMYDFSDLSYRPSNCLYVSQVWNANMYLQGYVVPDSSLSISLRYSSPILHSKEYRGEICQNKDH